MQNGSDQFPLGFNIMFANNIAIQEYFNSLPKGVRNEIDAHSGEFSSIGEIRSYVNDLMKKS